MLRRLIMPRSSACSDPLRVSATERPKPAPASDATRGGPWPITTRVALLSALFAAAALACVVGLAYWELSNALRARAHAELTAERDIIRNALANTSSVREMTAFDGRSSALRGEHAGLSIAVLPADPGPAFVAIGQNARELLARDLSEPWSGVREFVDAASFLAVVADRVSLHDGTAVRIAVAIDRSSDRELLAAYRWRLLIVWIAAIVLIGAIAGVVARSSIALLKTFTLQVSEISANRLGRQIAAESVPAELRELAVTFNDLLSRLDDAFRRLDRFSADIAHELRSPVANLVTRTQIALSRSRSGSEYLGALESNAEELERLRRMVDDMLLLARAENPSTEIARTPIDLRGLCEELAEFFRLSAEDNGLRIEVSGKASTVGDRALLRRAVSNLLSNALRHAKPASTIRVIVDTDMDRHASVSVENAGAGIGADLEPHIFDRFVCGDASGRRIDGRIRTGLGLAIVRSIMHLHGGDVGVEAPAWGVTRFRLSFGADTAG